MREKLKKMRQEWHMPCMTYAEEAIAIDIGIKLPEIPLPEPVTFSGIHDGKRNDAVQASLYDAMLAELICEKYAEKRLHEKHRAGQKYRHRKPEDRNSKGEHWSMVCEHMECGNSYVRNYHREKILRKDYEIEMINIEVDAEFKRYDDMVECERLNNWLKYA